MAGRTEIKLHRNKPMKRLIQSTLNTFGYEIRKFNRKPNIALYSSLYPQDSIKNKRFYNIGAGAFSHPCWTNVDYDSEWYASNRSKTLTGIQYDFFHLNHFRSILIQQKLFIRAILLNISMMKQLKICSTSLSEY